MIRNRLKSIRHQLEIDTQTEFAELIEIDRKHYNRYERQEVQPNLETAILIAQKLNRPVEEIFYIYIEPDE